MLPAHRGWPRAAWALAWTVSGGGSCRGSLKLHRGKSAAWPRWPQAPPSRYRRWARRPVLTAQESAVPWTPRPGPAPRAGSTTRPEVASAAAAWRAAPSPRLRAPPQRRLQWAGSRRQPYKRWPRHSSLSSTWTRMRSCTRWPRFSRRRLRRPPPWPRPHLPRQQEMLWVADFRAVLRSLRSTSGLRCWIFEQSGVRPLVFQVSDLSVLRMSFFFGSRRVHGDP